MCANYFSVKLEKGEKSWLIYFLSLGINCSVKGMERLPQNLTFLVRNPESSVSAMLVTEILLKKTNLSKKGIYWLS